MGLDISGVRQNELFRSEYHFKKEIIYKNVTKEMVKENYEEVISCIGDEEKVYVVFEVHDEKTNSYVKKEEEFKKIDVFKKFYETWIETFDYERYEDQYPEYEKVLPNGRRLSMSWYKEATKEYNMDDNERFTCELTRHSMKSLFDGKEYVNVKKVYYKLGDNTEVPLYEDYRARNDFAWFDFSMSRNETMYLDRQYNNIILDFIYEYFEGFELTPREKSFVHIIKHYSFYNSNDPWEYPAFFMAQAYDMFKKYKPEYLEQEIWNSEKETKESLDKFLQHCIENNIDIIAG